MRRFWAWGKRTFTFHRWFVNPFQMYNTMFLLLVSTAQMGLGIAPNVVLNALDIRTQLSLAFCNFIGALIVLYGLHLQEIETALWVELSGYFCLIFVLGIYVALLISQQTQPASTYGFGFSTAFIYASVHRSVQIWLYKRVVRKRALLADQVKGLRTVLGVEHDPFGGING